MMIDRAAVIIRSVGERTEALCAHLIKQQVPEALVVMIHERPFSRAVRRSFEIGLEYGLDWTLCVDADVLLHNEGVQNLLKEAEALPVVPFTFSGAFIDKLLGHVRPGGAHLYRTSCCDKALQYVGDSDAEIRPETYVKVQMAKQGFPIVTNEKLIIGIHDFEQYYADIYRKAITHAHKFTERMAYASLIWQRLAREDFDYRVALWGYRAGQIFDGKVQINRDLFPADICAFLRLSGAWEKEPLTEQNWNVDVAQQMIEQYSPPAEYVAWSRIRSLKKRKLGWLRSGIATVGLWRALPWLLGQRLQSTGMRLQQWAERNRQAQDTLTSR